MKRITLLLIALWMGATAGLAQGERIVCDETCRIEYLEAQPVSISGYAVVSPVGRTSVEMITQAPRL